MPETFDKLNPGEWGRKPHVQVGDPEFAEQLGPYPMVLFSSTLQSTGLITYHHLLAVCNPEGQDLCFASAESNPMFGAGAVYFCFQDPSTHGNDFDSKLLLITPVFFCFACQRVRSYLDLDWDQAPMIEPERQGLLAIPRVCDEYVPGWRSQYRGVIEQLLGGIPEGIVERDWLSNELDRL